MEGGVRSLGWHPTPPLRGHLHMPEGALLTHTPKPKKKKGLIVWVRSHPSCWESRHTNLLGAGTSAACRHHFRFARSHFRGKNKIKLAPKNTHPHLGSVDRKKVVRRAQPHYYSPTDKQHRRGDSLSLSHHTKFSLYIYFSRLPRT